MAIFLPMLSFLPLRYLSASSLRKQDPERARMADPVQRSWRTFVLSWLLWSAGWFAGLYLFVAIVDPFDTLAFSPDWKRHRVTGNERFELPGLMKRGHFDSAVFGTSTVLLLDPSALDAALGGHFVNAA